MSTEGDKKEQPKTFWGWIEFCYEFLNREAFFLACLSLGVFVFWILLKDFFSYGSPPGEGLASPEALLKGFGVSVVLGHFITAAFIYRHRWGERLAKRSGLVYVSGRMTGFLERVIFTAMVAANVENIGAAMIAWIGAKMLANWKYAYEKPPEEVLPEYLNGSNEEKVKALQKFSEKKWSWKQRHWAFERTALIGSLISVFFGVIGGLVCRGMIWPAA
jgi:hypothetical protein